MPTIHTNDPSVIAVARKAFPSYRGKTFEVEVTDHPINVKSYWDGGSREYFNFIRLDTLEVFGEIPPQSAFDKPIQGADAVHLVPGLACVRHSIFCGKDMGCTVMVHPDNAAKYLPAPVELTTDEKIVLSATRGLKSSYAGISNYRYHEAHETTGITLERWEAAKTSLIGRGLLNKAGAITGDGRNAIGDVDLHNLKA